MKKIILVCFLLAFGFSVNLSSNLFNIPINLTVATSISVNGTVTANSFVGNGAGLTGLTVSQLPSGTVTNNYTGNVTVNGTINSNVYSFIGSSWVISTANATLTTGNINLAIPIGGVTYYIKANTGQ